MTGIDDESDSTDSTAETLESPAGALPPQRPARTSDDDSAVNATLLVESGTDADDEPEFRVAGNSLCGTTIGVYTLVERIGRGGFGDVYRAEQTEPVRRSVALKILKPGMDSEVIVQRFAAERQALALMDHSGIARVFDAGVTTDGRSYFVMELVRGISITQYCDSNELDLRARVELLIKVCLALEHAHQRGIVHRDVKPSNILVGTEDGVALPRVIDFGIAKATEQPLTEFPAQTQTYELLGTPRYMSPEQTGAMNLEVDRRTDIYSLGVVLYELATGQTPFLKETESLGAPMGWVTVIREQEPQRPSTLVMKLGQQAATIARCRGTEQIHGLSRELREDLDWIILKCLEKDRELRYSSAADLAADLKNYMDHLPVVAGRPGWMARLRKIARRRRDAFRITVGFSVAIVALLIAGGFLFRGNLLQKENITHLQDVKSAQMLVSRVPLLVFEPEDRRRSDLEAWIAEADSLLSRRERAVRVRDELQNQSDLTRTADTAPADSGQSDDLVARLKDAQTLVSLMDKLQESDGLRQQVADWLGRCPSPDQTEQIWNAAAVGIAADYGGLTIADRSHLVPIGVCPQSGLWEFTDTQFGVLPIRDDQGVARLDAVSGVIYVLVPGGTYQMGSPETEPGRKRDELQHEVRMTPFLISKYEITLNHWGRIMDVVPGSSDRFDYPACNISWTEAAAFCDRAGCRLPTEAQWEYACRAGSDQPFSGADEMAELGWFSENSHADRQRVGTKQGNAFGLYDMHGNAIEWCRDIYSEEFYPSAESAGPDPIYDPPSDSGEPVDLTRQRVLRGGGYDGRSVYCRSADRYREYPGKTDVHGTFGFRTVRTIQSKP